MRGGATGGRGKGKGKGGAGGSQPSPPHQPQPSHQPAPPHQPQPQPLPPHQPQPSHQHSPQPQPSSQPHPPPPPPPPRQDNVRNIEQARMQRIVIGMAATRDIVADIVQWRTLIEAAVDGKFSVLEDVIREEEECRKVIAEAEKRLIDTKNQAYEEFMQEVDAARQRMLEKMNGVQHEVTGVIAAAQQRLATLNTHANTNADLALGREMSNDLQGNVNNMRTLLQQRMEPHTAILNQQRATQ